MNHIVFIGVIAYIIVQFAVAMWVSRRVKNEADYLLGGRQLGTSLAAFSIFATWFGVETVLGSAGRVYSHGLSGAQGEPFAYAVGILLMGLFFVIPLWRRGLTTFGDLFRARFSPGVERLTVILLVPGSVLWAAAQIRGFGQVMGFTTGLELTIAITIAAVLVMIYTSAGGMLADVYSDFVQAIAIVIGLGALLFFIMTHAESAGQGMAAVDAARFMPMRKDQPLSDFLEQWAIPICGSLVSVELISRILACKSEKVAMRSARLGGAFYLGVAMIPLYLGLIGPQVFPELGEAEQIIPALAHKYLPTFAYVMFAGALIAAILSTVDSALLAAGSLVSHNLVLRVKPNVSERWKLRISRACVFIFGGIAYILALRANAISELVETASAFGSAGVFVTACFGLFTTFGGAKSAYASIAAGMLVWGSGKLLGLPAPYLWALTAAFTGYVATAFFDKSRATAGQKALDLAN